MSIEGAQVPSLQSEPLTPYDVIVELTSLYEFVSSGNVEVLQAVQSTLDIALRKRWCIIAVVGLPNTGKTFMINKILRTNLPSSKVFATKGFRFLCVRERRMLVLNCDVPDEQATGSLMFEMISRIAHSVIFAVNDFTRKEQKWITTWVQKYVQRQPNPQGPQSLIVLHNLRTTGNIEEARRLFRRQITSVYDVDSAERSLPQEYQGDGFYGVYDLTFFPREEFDMPSELSICHLGVCEQSSVAGQYFNKRNIKIVMQIFDHGTSLGASIVLSDLISAELSLLLPKYVNIEGADGSRTEIAQQCAVTYENQGPYEGSTQRDGYRVVGTFKMQNQSPVLRLVMKTWEVFSSLGEVIEHNGSFDPEIYAWFPTLNPKMVLQLFPKQPPTQSPDQESELTIACHNLVGDEVASVTIEQEDDCTKLHEKIAAAVRSSLNSDILETDDLQLTVPGGARPLDMDSQSAVHALRLEYQQGTDLDSDK